MTDRSMHGVKNSPRPTAKKRYPRNVIKNNLEMYSMFLPTAILIIVFCYLPIYGIVVAFQDYSPGGAFIGPDVKWVGFKHFINFVNGRYFSRLIKNTLLLSGMNLLFGFWVPIVFSLLLNEIKLLKLKKFVQTASYLPYFISMVVVSGMVISFIDVGGIINNILSIFGIPPTNLRLDPNAFPAIYTVTNIWKSFGFSSILYLSTMSSIDLNLYEAARIDGGNRLQQAWYITLPGLKNIIAINLILSIGGILHTNTEIILLLYLPATYDTADVIGTYVYRMGIQNGQFSATAAIGLFMSVIGFAMTFCANKISNKLTGYGLW